MTLESIAMFGDDATISLPAPGRLTNPAMPGTAVIGASYAQRARSLSQAHP